MRSFSSSLCCLLLAGSMALGQDPGPKRYFPLNTPFPPPGRAGDWAGQLGKATPVRFQPVEIQLPGEGQVTWYSSRGKDSALAGSAPSMAGLLVGPVYRLKLSDMPDFPGVELYPTIEMVDRLHPPAGREAEFPVIIPFTEYELSSAAEGRLVTKVIYLEQPNRASLQVAGRGKAVAPLQISPRANPLEVADINGRPLAIVRLGGRVPDVTRPEPGFFGSGAPVQSIQVQSTQPPAAAETTKGAVPTEIGETVETSEPTEATEPSIESKPSESTAEAENNEFE